MATGRSPSLVNSILAFYVYIQGNYPMRDLCIVCIISGGGAHLMVHLSGPNPTLQFAPMQMDWIIASTNTPCEWTRFVGPMIFYIGGPTQIVKFPKVPSQGGPHSVVCIAHTGSRLSIYIANQGIPIVFVTHIHQLNLEGYQTHCVRDWSRQPFNWKAQLEFLTIQ